MKNQFLTVAETAKILRLSPRRVQELAQAGRLDGETFSIGRVAISECAGNGRAGGAARDEFANRCVEQIYRVKCAGLGRAKRETVFLRSGGDIPSADRAERQREKH